MLLPSIGTPLAAKSQVNRGPHQSCLSPPEAIDEAQAARQWYAEKGQELGDAFLAELDHAVEQISTNPNAWPPFEEHTRRYIMYRFPFCVVYKTDVDRILVVAIMHGKRKPGYWKTR